MIIDLLIFPLLFSFLLSLAVTPIVIKIAWQLGLIDNPKTNKHPKVIHTYPTPRAGGIAIFFSFCVACLYFLPIDKHLTGILLGSFFAVLIGAIDDKYDISPKIRIITCLICALFVVAGGITIPYVNNPFGGILQLDKAIINVEILGNNLQIFILADLAAILWIVWCMNIVNWSSGLDGQISGIIPIAAVVIGFLSLNFSPDITQWSVAIFSVIIAGAYLGFLPYHFYPQKIMPGFGGTTLAGLLLAVLSILSGAKINTAILVLGIPMIDGGWTIIRRIVTKKSPLQGDRGHLHHRLYDLGWSKRKIALFYWSITGLLGILAINLNSRQKFYTIIMLIIVIGGILIWLKLLKASSSPPDQSSG